MVGNFLDRKFQEALFKVNGALIEWKLIGVYCLQT